MRCSRREVLLTAAGVSLGCGGEEGPDACPGPSPVPGPGWVEVSLAEVPALETLGEAVLVRPSALLDVWLLKLGPDCYRAVWRVCTHGACEVEARRQGARRELHCPCHDSRFGLDGTVLEGPARRPLRTFPAVRVGQSLFIQR